MLKFNLTQEGKGLIDALQNNDKLAITHVRLLNNIGGDSPVDLPVRSGAVVIDGTCNGPYVVVDVNDASDKNYLSDNVALLSGESEVATLYQGTDTSGYEVVLSGGLQGRNAYPSIKYRTQNWASKKIPSSVNVMYYSGNDYDVLLSFGSKGGDPEDPSQQMVTERITLGDNFPKTITFSNGDIWETDDTVSTAGIKTNDFSYDANSGDGNLSIRPLYSKISIQKESNKQLKLRLSCQFDGAEKCKFNTTSINLPYASRFREGVVRFTDTSDPWISDGQKYNTVYSAKDVDDKIDAVTESLGNLDQYAKKAERNEFIATNMFKAGIIVDGEIGGTAVTDAGTDGDKHIVNVGYADGKYLSKTEASSTYLTQENASTTYLTQENAGKTYLTQVLAAKTYLTKDEAGTAATNYAKLNDGNTFTGAVNTFNGDVTVKGTFAVGDSQNAATFAVTNYGISGTAIQNDKIDDLQSAMLPTEGAVKKALNAVESALTEKDNDLQSQIDGINAGQNLADIVETTDVLKAYDVSHLKAKGDSLPGKPSTPLTIGDKVQVLGGADAQSSVYELIKGTKPEGETNSIQSTNNTSYYWHYIGVYGTNAYTKAEIDDKVNTINSAIGTKADTSYVNTELAKKANSTDVYSKNEADGKFAQLTADNEFTGNNTFTGIITGDAVTSDIAADVEGQGVKLTTSTGVSNFVTKVVDDKITELQGGMSYLKLTSTEKQTVASDVDFNGTIGGTAVTDTSMAEDAIPNSKAKLVSLGFAENRYAKLGDNNKFLGKNNTFEAITATAFNGDGVATQISTQGTRLPTESAVASFVGDKFAENRYDISNKDQVGAMGLFLYTGGDFKEMGTEVAGTSLQAVGMQLPMDGVVSWSQGAAMKGQWKLLNNTIAGEPCLVLAIRVG